MTYKGIAEWLAITLTTGTDSFIGAAGNDSFIATNSTLNTGDVLNGGAGTDTVSVAASVSGNSVLAGFTTTSVENLNVNVSDADSAMQHTLTVNLAGVSGAAAVQVSGSTAADANDDIVVLNNVASGVALSLNNTTNLNVSATYASAATAGTADKISINLNGATSSAVGDGLLTIAAGFESADINSSGSSSTLGDLLLNGTKSVTVTGDAGLRVRDALDNAVTTVNASALTGALTLVLGNGANTVTGGTGVDSITAGAGAVAESISTGAGNDRIIFTGNLSANTATKANNDTVNGGDGRDTLVGTSANLVTTDNTVSGADQSISNIEVVEVSNAFDGTLSVAKIQATGIDTVTLALTGAALIAGSNDTITGAAGSFTVNLGAAAAANTAGVLGGDLAITAAGTATSDALSINLNATNSTDSKGADTLNGKNLTVTGYETVTIAAPTTVAGSDDEEVGTLAVNASATTAAVTVNFTSVANAYAVTSLTTTSTALLSINASGVAAGTGTAFTLSGTTSGTDGTQSITGSAGNDLITVGAFKATVDGGAGNDTITGGGAAQNLQGGAGDDRFVFAGTDLGTTDSISGGDGTDVLAVNNAAVTELRNAALNAIVSFNNNTSSVERLAITNSFDQGADFDLARADSINFVSLEAGFTGNESLVGFSAAPTIQLRAAANAGTDVLTVALADATGTSDSVTVALINDNATDFGDVSITNIENLTITTAEATATDTVEILTLGIVSAGLSALTVTGTESLNISQSAVNASKVDASGLIASGAGAVAGINVLGGAASQSFIGGGGADTIDGGSAADTISGGGGGDSLVGGAGNDSITGDAGADSISGGTGNDVIDGGTGDDKLAWVSGDGTDSIVFAATDDYYFKEGAAGDEFNLAVTAGANVAFNGANVNVAGANFQNVASNNVGAGVAATEVLIFRGAFDGDVYANSGEVLTAYNAGSTANDIGTTALFLIYETGPNTYRLTFDSDGTTAGGETVIATFTGLTDALAAAVAATDFFFFT